MPVAPYQYVAAEIRRRIANGAWPTGHQLPSQAALARELGVTLAAARRGTSVLRRAGVLEGTARTRLFVAHPPAVRTLLNADADWPHPTGDGGAIGACRATPDLAARLHLRTGTHLHWERLECLDPDLRPSHLITTWWTGRRATEWASAISEAGLHELTTVEAEVLGLATGQPAWLVQRTRIGHHGQPIETADLVMPADRWRMRLH
jgi:GntR family transcriptional regulator